MLSVVFRVLYAIFICVSLKSRVIFLVPLLLYVNVARFVF
jgi:hypothetical protein